MLLAPAAFNACFAQSAAVSEKTFDWIFFVIIGLPFLIALVALLRPGMLDRYVRDWPWEIRRAELETRQSGTGERADGTPQA
jgi:hypothetical protein